MLAFEMLAIVEPYDRLWHTVHKFHEQYDKWYIVIQVDVILFNKLIFKVLWSVC